ncbi:DUF1707 domain-containing protein [Nocardia wallacei]|uniref:DUF1707 domain-containing protein n=1 Tax=Nocardia wallacei TaxID=480035 RepID=UPI00313C6DFB
MADSPDIRIGTAEREKAMEQLSQHFAAGRLSVAEFDERSGVIAAAVTRGDLAQVFADLPQPVADEPGPPRPRPGGRPQVRGPAMGLTVIVALVLFFTTGSWLWFLMIPAAGILIGSVARGGGRRRHEILAEHRLEAEAHRLEIEQHRREMKQQARELRQQYRNRRRGR